MTNTHLDKYLYNIQEYTKEDLDLFKKVFTKLCNEDVDIYLEANPTPWDHFPVGGGGGSSALTVAAIVAAAAAASIVAYKKFFSKAAKACQGRPDKSECMKKHKVQALKQQVKVLQSNKKHCSKAKTPAICSAKIDSKIATIKAKI